MSIQVYPPKSLNLFDYNPTSFEVTGSKINKEEPVEALVVNNKAVVKSIAGLNEDKYEELPADEGFGAFTDSISIKNFLGETLNYRVLVYTDTSKNVYAKLFQYSGGKITAGSAVKLNDSETLNSANSGISVSFSKTRDDFIVCYDDNSRYGKFKYIKINSISSMTVGTYNETSYINSAKGGHTIFATISEFTDSTYTYFAVIAAPFESSYDYTYLHCYRVEKNNPSSITRVSSFNFSTYWYNGRALFGCVFQNYGDDLQIRIMCSDQSSGFLRVERVHFNWVSRQVIGISILDQDQYQMSQWTTSGSNFSYMYSFGKSNAFMGFVDTNYNRFMVFRDCLSDINDGLSGSYDAFQLYEPVWRPLDSIQIGNITYVLAYQFQSPQSHFIFSIENKKITSLRFIAAPNISLGTPSVTKLTEFNGVPYVFIVESGQIKFKEVGRATTVNTESLNVFIGSADTLFNQVISFYNTQFNYTGDIVYHQYQSVGQHFYKIADNKYLFAYYSGSVSDVYFLIEVVNGVYYIRWRYAVAGTFQDVFKYPTIIRSISGEINGVKYIELVGFYSNSFYLVRFLENNQTAIRKSVTIPASLEQYAYHKPIIKGNTFYYLKKSGTSGGYIRIDVDRTDNANPILSVGLSSNLVDFNALLGSAGNSITSIGMELFNNSGDGLFIAGASSYYFMTFASGLDGPTPNIRTTGSINFNDYIYLSDSSKGFDTLNVEDNKILMFFNGFIFLIKNNAGTISKTTIGNYYHIQSNYGLRDFSSPPWFFSVRVIKFTDNIIYLLCTKRSGISKVYKMKWFPTTETLTLEDEIDFHQSRDKSYYIQEISTSGEPCNVTVDSNDVVECMRHPDYSNIQPYFGFNHYKYIPGVTLNEFTRNANYTAGWGGYKTNFNSPNNINSICFLADGNRDEAHILSVNPQNSKAYRKTLKSHVFSTSTKRCFIHWINDLEFILSTNEDPVKYYYYSIDQDSLNLTLHHTLSTGFSSSSYGQRVMTKSSVNANKVYSFHCAYDSPNSIYKLRGYEITVDTVNKTLSAVDKGFFGSFNYYWTNSDDSARVVTVPHTTDATKEYFFIVSKNLSGSTHWLYTNTIYNNNGSLSLTEMTNRIQIANTSTQLIIEKTEDNRLIVYFAGLTSGDRTNSNLVVYTMTNGSITSSSYNSFSEIYANDGSNHAAQFWYKNNYIWLWSPYRIYPSSSAQLYELRVFKITNGTISLVRRFERAGATPNSANSYFPQTGFNNLRLGNLVLNFMTYSDTLMVQKNYFETIQEKTYEFVGAEKTYSGEVFYGANYVSEFYANLNDKIVAVIYKDGVTKFRYYKNETFMNEVSVTGASSTGPWFLNWKLGTLGIMCFTSHFANSGGQRCRIFNITNDTLSLTYNFALPSGINLPININEAIFNVSGSLWGILYAVGTGTQTWRLQVVEIISTGITSKIAEQVIFSDSEQGHFNSATLNNSCGIQRIKDLSPVVYYYFSKAARYAYIGINYTTLQYTGYTEPTNITGGKPFKITENDSSDLFSVQLTNTAITIVQSTNGGESRATKLNAVSLTNAGFDTSVVSSIQNNLLLEKLTYQPNVLVWIFVASLTSGKQAIIERRIKFDLTAGTISKISEHTYFVDTTFTGSYPYGSIFYDMSYYNFIGISALSTLRAFGRVLIRVNSSSNFYGFSQEEVEPGNKALVSYGGKVSKVHDGLVPYRIYYLDPITLKPTLTQTSVELGMSLNSTTILLKLPTAVKDFITANIV